MLILDAAQGLAVLLALLTAPILVIGHGLLRRFHFGLVLAAAAHGAAWLALCVFQNIVDFGPADYVAGGALLGALWLGWFQIYSVLCRGFSLQLMVEIERRPQSLSELASGYADGRGIDWLLDKRVRGLRSAGLLKAPMPGAPERVESTLTGRRLARLAGIYKYLTGIGAGG